MALTDVLSAARSSARGDTVSAMASGAPLAATTNCLRVTGRLPDLRHGEEIGTKPVSVGELPFGAMQMLGPGEAFAAQLMEGLVHRVERFGRAGKNAELGEAVELVRQVRVVRFTRPKRLPSASRSSAMDIRFSVRVPVLSVQNTVAEPSVSIAAARRVRTRAREIRHAPIAMKTASTTGNSSGSIDMPSAMPASTASSQPPRNGAVEDNREDAHRAADHGKHPHKTSGSAPAVAAVPSPMC